MEKPEHINHLEQHQTHQQIEKKPSVAENLLERATVSSIEKPADDTQITKEFNDLFFQLYGQNADVQRIAEQFQKGEPFSDTFEAYQKLASIIPTLDTGRDHEQVTGMPISVAEARKWAYTPDTIKQTHTVNCSGAGIMATAVLKSLGVEAYPANPNGHVATFIHQKNGDWLYLDARNGFVERLNHPQVAQKEGSRRGIIKLDKPVRGGFKLIPFYTSIQDAQNHFINENHHALLEEIENASAAPEEQEKLKYSKVLFGESFDEELRLKPLKEKHELDETEEWKQEEKASNADDNVNNLMRDFVQTLQESNAHSLTRLQELFKRDPSAKEQFINYLELPTEEVAKFEESKSILGKDLSSTANIPRETLLKAHRLFREGTQPIRDIDPLRFQQQIRTILEATTKA